MKYAYKVLWGCAQYVRSYVEVGSKCHIAIYGAFFYQFYFFFLLIMIY